MRSLYLCLAAAVLSTLACQPAFADCPPNASPSYETGNVVHCKCNAGYENRGGGCRPVPVMRARPEPTMRARPAPSLRAVTRAECVRLAGEQLKKDLNKCRSPVVSCLTSVGVRINEATCTASTLVSALALALDPTKISTAVVGTTVAGAVVVCGREAYDAVEKCEPVWGTCQNGPLQAHKDAIAACPKQ